jgi:hypothetical protein
MVNSLGTWKQIWIFLPKKIDILWVWLVGVPSNLPWLKNQLLYQVYCSLMSESLNHHRVFELSIQITSLYLNQFDSMLALGPFPQASFYAPRSGEGFHSCWERINALSELPSMTHQLCHQRLKRAWNDPPLTSREISPLQLIIEEKFWFKSS